MLVKNDNTGGGGGGGLLPQESKFIMLLFAFLFNYNFFLVSLFH